MDPKQERAELLKAAQAIVDGAKASNRDLTDDEIANIEVKTTRIKELGEIIVKAEKSAKLIADLSAVAGDPPPEDTDEPAVGGGSLGAKFVRSDAFRAFRKAHPTGVDGGTPVSIKATGLGGLRALGFKADPPEEGDSTLTTGTGQPVPQRLPGYQDQLLYNPLTLLDLITTGSTNSASLEYAQVVAETDNAAIVAEGDLKPLSDIETKTADAKVHTYADGFDATNQFLADEPALAAFMNSAVERHLRNKIEDVILNGAGTPTEPAGILHTTGVQNQDFDTDAVTTVAGALEKVDSVNAEAQAIVVNPTDAWKLRLLKDADGRYLSGGPFVAGLTPSLWGVPLVQSRRVKAGTALVGNFRTVNLLEREPLSILLFNQHKDYAQRNKVYVRAEIRAMQLIFAPREIVVATIAGS